MQNNYKDKIKQKQNTATRIISIDPGYDRLGIAILEKTKGEKEKLIHSECFTTNKKESVNQRMYQCANHIEQIIKTYNPQYIVIEQVFFSKNKSTSINIAQTIGMIKLISQKHKIQIKELNPSEIKIAITGNGKATKKSILLIITHLIDIKKPASKLDDEIDAIACGLAFFATHSITKNPLHLKENNN